ncbi:hypothetical protein EW146_g7987 [Bondarzewia mesenterica]|uniref:TRP C-terminal domain-containing protein n=1 Tax=Bondarzewia mesenterica TaxID=1095465 RepID=A0A4S4LHW4_9AGAM|nr:hypothetical protein EW146_g7987 [Bondarzewia mesenterica]
MAVDPFMGTRAQKAFIATMFDPAHVEAIVVLVMISITFRLVAEHVDFSSTSYYKTLPCYLALFLLAELFELVMAFDALRLRNVIQLVGILLFHLALIVFAALQVHETHTALVRLQDCNGSDDFVRCGGAHTLFRKVEPFLIVVPCIIAVAWVAIVWFARALYAEFGWAIFRVVGANPAMKTMYQFYQVMICLLKFDFFCFTGVTIQLLIVVLDTSSAEFGLTVAAIPIVLILLIGCGLAVQREIRWLMVSSLVLMLAAETYLYKLVRFFEPSSEAQYETTRATLTVFTIVAFLLLLTTFGVGLRCFNDFGKGLVTSKTYGQWYPLCLRRPSARPRRQLILPFPCNADAPLFKRNQNSYANPEQKGDGGELEPRLSIE